MDSKSVTLGKWNNHGNEMNLILSAQNSQKVNTDAELKLKHGNKHIITVETTADLKKALEYTALREVQGLTLEKAYKAVKLYNKYHKTEINPQEAIKGWKLENKIKNS